MGLTPRQRLWQVELPLALPAILAATRIVLVQNIGLTVIAGLIGGGGFGSFVFQGRNQASTDMILLGALLGRSRTWLLTHDDAPLDAAQQTRWQDWLARRADGVPERPATQHSMVPASNGSSGRPRMVKWSPSTPALVAKLAVASNARMKAGRQSG